MYLINPSEMMEYAKHKNLIICLPTGSGKTCICAMLIKALAEKSRLKLANGGKRTVFLVPTVALVRQQSQYIRDNTGMIVGEYHGEIIDTKSNEKKQLWYKNFDDNQILVITSQLFLDVLCHKLFSLDDVNLLIFDECHHSAGNSSYAQIMNLHYDDCNQKPRVLGLTASISAKKIKACELENEAKRLETTFRARVECGILRDEDVKYGTTVATEKCWCKSFTDVCNNNIKIIFDTLKRISKKIDEHQMKHKSKYDRLDNELGEIRLRKDYHTNMLKYTEKSSEYMQLVLSESPTMLNLKRQIDNIILIGQELGLIGLYLATQQLYIYQKKSQKFTNDSTFDDDVYKQIENLTNDIFDKEIKNSQWNNNMFSPKVWKLFCQIIEHHEKTISLENYDENSKMRCIIFVERISTALILNELLAILFIKIYPEYSEIFKSKYIVGNKSCTTKTSVTAKYQNEVLEQFRIGKINILVSTSVVEEDNFSSYMQAKGRARSKLNASYIILITRSKDYKADLNDKAQYQEYDEIEMMLRSGFSNYVDEDDGDITHLEPYRTKNSIINAARAVQLIYQYCSILGRGQIYPPRFLQITECGQCKCILTMPANCPIGDDVILRKYCSSNVESEANDNNWYLYRIHIISPIGSVYNNEIGFMIPLEMPDLPKFNIYDARNSYTVKIVNICTINYNQYQPQIDLFCRYLFENVFDFGNNSQLQYDSKKSPYKMMPCLLNEDDSIDIDRMIQICARSEKPVENPKNINKNELYRPWNLNEKKLFYIVDTDDLSQTKFAHAAWEHGEKYKTYADYYETKLKKQDRNVKINLNWPMACGNYWGKKADNFLYPHALSSTKVTITTIEDECKYYYYPVELLNYAPVNKNDQQLFSKLPTIFTRITQLYHVEKLRRLIVKNIDTNRKSEEQTYLELPLPELAYDNLTSSTSNKQLPPSVLFQALRRDSTGEKTNMENLEILGDCFLKLSVSLSMYYKYAKENVGFLTVEKVKFISNNMLYRCAIRKGLESFLYAQKIEYRGKNANWLPPGYVVVKKENNFHPFTMQIVKYKSLADMIEAIIGGILITHGYTDALKFSQWLGLDVFPQDENVEKRLNYQFKKKAYLIAAFTHPSCYTNRFTQSYERLEFIGDAILDYLVTREIFIKNNKITPQIVTDIRQDIANNGRLAYLFAENKLHHYILHDSSILFREISIYIARHSLDEKISLGEDLTMWADSTAPKTLADVFEALVGAIFLDSNSSLKVVWDVFEPILKKYIENSIIDPNLNPVRRFYESGGKIIREYVNQQSGSSVCKVGISGDDVTYEGIGKNKRDAKFNACQKAMKFRN
ncbi:unnamed protein product [Didymodactylos carnosus]|uniref:Uncharacterized protein n=1 Tax=Didymodactylos carnosus TaxID=1234261 RepID=A0A8S2DAU9_9BILA|nr:unnamed protein product [Didymodactylos carnosus]CAF3672347.1 unnamed protein product [Didymodactylos carnosus]